MTWFFLIFLVLQADGAPGPQLSPVGFATYQGCVEAGNATATDWLAKHGDDLHAVWQCMDVDFKASDPIPTIAPEKNGGAA